MEDEGWIEALEQKDRLVTVFKEAMKARYGHDFDRLDNIRDLQALLAADPQLPVHYPRPTQQPHPDGKNFEWFVGNKRSGRNAGPRRVLPHAVDDSEGLLLINRFGDEM